MLPLLAASLLIPGKTILTNVPDIIDVHDFIHFLESLQCRVIHTKNSLEIDASKVDNTHIDTSKIARTRAGIYFIAGLLARFGSAKIPYPKGDKIGKRPIDEHIVGYSQMGYNFSKDSQQLCFSGN